MELAPQANRSETTSWGGGLNVCRSPLDGLKETTWNELAQMLQREHVYNAGEEHQ